MSILDNPRDVLIYGGTFNSFASNQGIDLLQMHIAPGAFHNSAERYDQPKCHPNTRVAVIQAIIDWIEDGQKSSFIMWLNGPAGAGKSAIAQEIAELCHRSGCLVASFFWSRNAAGRNNEERLIASLTYQLLITFPQMRAHVQEALEKDPSLPSRSLAVQMESLISRPLDNVFAHDQQGPVHRETPKVIVLDGLDECGTPEVQQYILRVISRSVHKFPIPLCFLIASRPEQAIRNSFDNQPLFDITARLVLDEKYDPDDDVRLFLVESFQSIKRTHTQRSLLPQVWPIDEDIDRLVRKSSGQFIYATTVVKFVRSPRRKPSEQLDIILGTTAAGNSTPFAELDALYRGIFGLVEDFPRVFDILSCLLLLQSNKLGTDKLYARQLEEILSLSPGELQLILIDLHSLVHVPEIGDEKDDFRFLHASLQDFLMNSTRARQFYIDEGRAHAGIAQHFLRYIRNCSQGSKDRYINNLTTAKCLYYHCYHSSATTELLADFLHFDSIKWISMHTTAWESGLELSVVAHAYQINIALYTWLQAQEANAPEYHGRGKIPSQTWKVVVDSMCKAVCHYEICWNLNPSSERARNMVTASTHPQISDFSRYREGFFGVMGGHLFFTNFAYDPLGSTWVELQTYLRDPKRAGKYFVDSGMYTTLSMRIFKFIFNYKPLWIHHMGEHLTYMAIRIAIKFLPFYLLNADYTPELATCARSLLSHKIEDKEEMHHEIRLLHEAIDQYLRRESSALSEPQEKFQRYSYTLEIGPIIELELEEHIDTAPYLCEQRFRAEKRRRNSRESLEVTNLTTRVAPTPIPPPFKRLRMIDLLNPETGSQLDSY